MERVIKECKSRIVPLMLPKKREPEILRAWLTKRAKRYRLCWLLAHTDSGVIWGKLHNDKLSLSSEAFVDQSVVVSLDWTTLQQCRLFGAMGELLLWQASDGWQARLRCDEAENGNEGFCLDEAYLLWGTRQENAAKGFLLLAEGSQGIMHAPPLDTSPTEARRAALLVRHYLREDPSSGQLRISASRLVELQEPQERSCFERTAAQGGAR